MRRPHLFLLVPILLASACTSAEAPGDSAGPSPSASPEGKPSPEPSPSEEQSRKPGKLRVLGHEDFGGAGFNGDVWAYGDHAYVGSYGGKTEPTACPPKGVRVVDISDPLRPEVTASLQTPAGTTAEDVVVRDVRTKHWSGPIAAVGIQACNLDEGSQPQTFRGLQFFDVSRPGSPKEISRWELPPETPGCHEVDFAVRKDRVLAGCAAPFAMNAGLDEAYIVDVFNPRSPKLAFSWALPDNPRTGVGCLPVQVVHNVRFDKAVNKLYVSYWDAGTPILRIRDLSNPRLLGIVEETPLDPDGDNHSVAQIPGGLLMVLHEDFSPALPEAKFGGCGSDFGAWGSLRIYDVNDPSKPKLVSEYRTENMKISEMTTPEIFTAHNAEVVGTHEAVVSWYSDGIRWLDISKPSRPLEIDTWIPPKAADPYNFIPTIPAVWGVYPLPDDDLILATDINSGLWILEAPNLGDPAASK